MSSSDPSAVTTAANVLVYVGRGLDITSDLMGSVLF